MTTRTKRALRSAALLGTSLACFACGPRSDAGTPMNVIVICLDTVRADHLGCYGYEKRETTPFMDSLAERSVLFEDASSTAGWTKPSVPSILTGMLPLQHGVYRGSARSENGAVSDVLADEALTLAEVYSERGYQSAAFVRNAQLRRGLGFEQGFDLYRDKAGDAREIRWRTSDWLDERDTQRPFFLYLHYLDAHWPYPVPEEYATRFTSPEQVEFLRSSDWRRLRDAVNDGAEQLSDDQLDALLALYDGALRYIDDELARLWEKLERDGLADDTIICIVADHGEEFMEHGRIGHGNGLYETLLDVPWILHVPGRAAQRVSKPVSLVDVFPTLLAASGIPIGVQGNGINQLDDAAGASPVIAEHLDSKRYHISWRSGDSKRVDVVEPNRLPSKSGSGLASLDTSMRWEASLRLQNGALPVLERLRPAHSQEARPPEVKGLIQRVAKDELHVLGVRVRLDDATELYGETHDSSGKSRPLQPGMLVKARGALSRGVLVAEKVKLYAEDAEHEFELRGPLEVLGVARVQVAGVDLTVDAKSVLEAGEKRADLSAIDVLALVGGEHTEASLRATQYELGSDALELAGESREDGFLGDPRRQVYLQDLLRRRAWGESTERVLDAKELDELRAIGYAE